MNVWLFKEYKNIPCWKDMFGVVGKSASFIGLVKFFGIGVVKIVRDAGVFLL